MKAVTPANPDRRVRRTHELLRAALLELILEKGYDRITIQDILDKADVGRSTFYAHFRDKEDLLDRGFDDVRAALRAERDAIEEPAGKKTEFLGPMIVVFQHVEGHRHLWQPLVRKGGSELALRLLRESAESLLREHLRSQFPNSSNSRFESALALTAGAFMGLVTWWIENDLPMPAADAQAMFRQMGVHGVRRLLSESA
jgi:AcrR family transcriptional regulator